LSILKPKKYRYGIHVSDRKDITKDLAICKIDTPEKVYLCTSQHIGAPATPVVSQGDYVKKGQLVAKESGFVSANVYSSVSGTVESITTLTNGMGQVGTYIVINNDGLFEETLLPPIDNFEKETLVSRIREAGIVGLGGAGFPTAVKLSPKTPVDTLIINGAECEPYLTCDYRLLLEREKDFVEGVKLSAKALGVNRIVIGIEANKPDAIERYGKYQEFDVVVLKKQYPMGSEKHLIYCTTGRKVKLGKLPADVGVCVLNVKTAIAIKEAIIDNKPLTETVITVSGKAINQPKNLKVPLGTPLTKIVEFCGGEKEDLRKYVAGGPMMGKALYSLNHYTKKTDSGLLLLSEKEVADTESMPTNCIRCGRCADNCPMRLIPSIMEYYVRNNEFEKAGNLGVLNCLECGSCAYNCPAKRPLVQSFSLAKSKVRELQKKQTEAKK
jgi:electron transport complex protein RnfC